MEKILRKLADFFDGFEKEHPRLFWIYYKISLIMNTIHKWIVATVNALINLCNEFVRPTTLYAFGLIIFHELYRVGEIDGHIPTEQVDSVLSMFMAAGLFAVFLIAMSGLWMFMVFYKWIMKIFEPIYNTDEKTITKTLIKIFAATITLMFTIAVFGYTLLSIASLVFTNDSTFPKNTPTNQKCLGEYNKELNRHKAEMTKIFSTCPTMKM